MLRTNLSYAMPLITVPKPVSLKIIPNISVDVGATHDMSQYMNDPSALRTTSSVNGLTTFASYDDTLGAEILTGTAAGTETGISLDMTD